MTHSSVRFLGLVASASMFVLPRLCTAQTTPYVGALGGFSTLSADARTVLALDHAATSSYKPENGPTADVYAGLHWNNYLSVQADFIWNRNRLILDGLIASTTAAGNVFYERTFHSHQYGALANLLLFFRPRSSRVRPFLSVGTGAVRFTAEPRSAGIVSGLSPP